MILKWEYVSLIIRNKSPLILQSIGNLAKYHLCLLLIIGGICVSYGQYNPSLLPDTLETSKPYFILADSSIVISRDTIVFLLDTTEEKMPEGGKGTDFYQALKRSAYKTKFTRELYHLFFVSPDKKSPTDTIKTERSETPFVQYQGKTIRNVRFKVLQPFGPKLYDTTLVASSWLEKSANRLHHSSREKSLMRQLHIKEGDRLDAFQLADNERLLRELPYIEDAYIRVLPVPGYSKLVDLLITVKDQFSWGVNMKISSIQSSEFELFNKNLYGIGHQFNNSFQLDSKEDQKFGYNGHYLVKNIRGSYLNTGIAYQNTFEKEVIQWDLFKDFETFNTKYAGGIVINRTRRSDRITPGDPIESEVPLDFNYENYWLGRSFRLNSRNLFTRKKMVLAARVANRSFSNRPEVKPELNQFYHNSTLYMASIAFSKTQYYKSNLIYNFGRTEDIPYGDLFQLTLGYEDREFFHRDYIGINLEKAVYLKKSRSYLFNRFTIGGFFHKSHFEQGVLAAETKFVSRLRKLGNYKFRNFGKVSYLLGIRRFEEEFINLNNNNGIRGFKSDLVNGNQRLHFNFESVAFSPYMLGGFRFALFSFADIGIIGSNNKIIFDQEYYSGFGFGIRLRNENLVFKTIQLRLTYYPKVPSDFSNIEFRLSGEIRPKFNDFSVGEPQLLEYK
jgi:hypothetical protein